MSELNNGVALEADNDNQEVKASSRRQLFGKGAAAVAVAAVAGVGASSRVSALNGSALLMGVSGNSATLTTGLTGGSTFKVTNGSTDEDASIYGVNNGTSSTGVRGESSGTQGYGVHGLGSGTDGIGVYGQFDGEGTRSGTGILGVSNLGSGVIGRGTSYDLYAGDSGKIGITSSTVNSSTSGRTGTLARDSSGVLWYCYANDNWQRVGGEAVAGSFTAIAPTRVYDSRLAGYAPNNGLLSAGTTRTVSVKDGRDDDGNVATANIVPAGATAVTYNVTVTATSARSFLSVVPGDVASTTASTVNWVGAGEVVANASLSKLDASRQLNLIPGPNGTFHCIIDITGYYL